jgi:hypothetical protein
LHNMFINEDLPTLLRPIKAYSGRSAVGHFSKSGLEIKYSAAFIIMHAW